MTECPCGGGELATCCGPFLAAVALPATAEQTMRSRYSAFVRGNAAHLLRTWHPRTRPATVDVAEAAGWTGLEVLDVVGGDPEDLTGVVEFVARHARHGEIRERSRFERRGGRWLYVEAAAGT